MINNNIILLELNNSVFLTNSETIINFSNKEYLPNLNICNINLSSINFNYKNLEIEIFYNIEEYINENNRIVIKKSGDKGNYYTIYRGYISGYEKINTNLFKVNISSIFNKLENTIGTLFSETCRNKLGDTNCLIDLETRKIEGRILKILSKNSFIGDHLEKEKQFYQFGKISINDEVYQIKNNPTSNEIHLFESLKTNLEVNQTYIIYPGCDKLLSTCKNKFQNTKNFNGEPFINKVKE